MKADVIKNSFVTGELGPSLYGRTDITQYSTACKIVENFLIRPYGPIRSTPGTTYIGEVKDSSKRTRLIQFVFSRTDSYIIEMGEEYFRFYTNQAVVVSTGTTPVEVSHPYSESEIFDVQFAQKDDIIYMTHPDHTPKRLIRNSATSWEVSDFDFLAGPFLDSNLSSITITPSATAGNITITLSATTSTLKFVPSGSTLGHRNSLWKIAGEVSDVQGYVKITSVSTSTVALATVIKTLSSSAATTDWAEGAWSGYRGFPSCTTFHEARLAFGRTDWEPDKIWLSKSFIYDDFTTGSTDDDALSLAMLSNEANDIKWLSSGKSLLIGTFGGIFSVNSPSGEPLTPSNANAKLVASWGVEPIIPSKIGSFLYHVQRFGTKLREIFYSWEVDSHKSVDRTILSPHILADGVVSMTYQQNPDNILWCVCTNGTLATMTREVDQEVQGWSRQVTDGSYEAIASIPSREGNYDEIWVVVNRTIDGSTVRYIELFDDLEPNSRQDLCNYLHSSLLYNGYSDAPSSATISFSATSGTVTVTSSGPYFVANDLNQRIRAIDSDGVTLGEGKISNVSSSTVVTLVTSKDFSTTSYADGEWALSVSELSGLDHLEGETVRVLADGGIDLPAKVVSSGTISLNYDYFVVLTGLQADQKLHLLPFEAGSAKGTSQGKKQRINNVGFKLNRSYTGFLVGRDSSHTTLVSTRDTSTYLGTPEPLVTGVVANKTFPGDYVYGAEIYIENNDPLPIEFLSIMADLDTIDK